MGTDAGLARFDGLQWKTYSQGLASPFVTDMDSRGDTLWMSTWGGGPHYLHGDSIKPLGNFIQYATGICAGPTLLASINLWWKENFMQYHYDGSPFYENPVCSCSDSTTLTYSTGCCAKLGYSGHLKCKDGSVKAFSPQGIYESRADGSFAPWRADIPAHALAEGKNDTWWVAWGNNIFSFKGKNGTIDQGGVFPKNLLGDNYITGLHELPGYGLAVETDGPARQRNTWLMHFPDGGLTNLANALGVKNNFTFCSVDRDGELWQGTYGDGVIHLFTPRNQVYAEADGLLSSSVRSLYEDPAGQLWVGTSNGLFVSNKDGHFDRMGSGIQGDIESVYQINGLPDGNTRVTVVTSGKGESYYSYNKNRQITDQPAFTKMSCENGELLYINGLYSFKSAFSNQPVSLDLAIDLRFTDILLDQNILWMASSKGIKSFDAKTGHKMDDLPSPYNTWKAQGIDKDPSGNIWIATLYGLIRRDKNGKITTWGEADGLLNTCVNAVQVDQQSRAWVGTSGGLQAMGADGKWLYFFKMRNGLADEYVTTLEMGTNNLLYVGSNKGVTTIDLANLPLPTSAPKVIIESVLLNGKPPITGQKPSAPFRSGAIIRVFAPTYLYPELVRYKYRLTEDAPWTETSNREIQLSNLAAGAYQFEVMAKLFDSDWGPVSKMPFQILPPWWQTPWFYLALLALAGLIVWLLLRDSKNRMERKRQIAELELRALQAQLNPHFVSNVLNGIQYYILKKDNVAVNEYFTRFARLTRSFLDASRLHFISLRKETEILRDYIELEKMRFEEKFDYRLTVADDLNPDVEKIPAMLIQPYIENALNHGLVYLEEKGFLDVSFFRDSRGLVCKIDDNGIGRAKAAEIRQKHKGSFKSVGTQITSEMAALLNRSGASGISIVITDKMNEDGSAAGTLVEVVLG